VRPTKVCVPLNRLSPDLLYSVVRMQTNLRISIGLSAALSVVTFTPLADAAEDSSVLDTIIVTGEKLPDTYAGGQVARGSRLGLLGNRDIMDTPFSTTGLTSEFLQEIGARSLSQALVADASVQLQQPTSQTFDAFNIRGFYTRPSDVTFDGLYGVGPPLQVAVETVERVELIKGPTSLLGGMSPNGAVGGSVNLVPKRAGDAPLLQLNGMHYGESQVGAHVDAGQRLGSDQQFGVRLNGVYRDGDSALEGNSQRSEDLVLGLDYSQGGLRVTGDLAYQKRVARGVDSDSYLETQTTPLPRVPDGDQRYLQPWIGQNADAQYGVVRAEYEFSPTLMTYFAIGYNENEGNYILSYALPLTSSGDFQENFWGTAFESSTTSTEVGARALIQTGPIEHQLAIAANQVDSTNRNSAFFDGSIDGSPGVSLAPNASNIYRPNFIPKPRLNGFARPPKTDTADLSGVSIADTMSFSQGKVLLTLGARLQKVETEAFDTTTGARSDRYDEDDISPAAAVVFRARDNLSFYANYMEGLSKGPTAPSNAINAGEIFAPYATEQMEAGVKLDLGTLGGGLAVFQIAQPSGIVDSRTLRFDLDGEQRHRGLELNVFGEPIEGVRLLGSAMLLDAKLTKTEGGLNNGDRPPGVSKVSTTLGADWSTPFLSGLALRASGTYTSSFVVGSQEVEAPSWTRMDLGARYNFDAAGRPVVLRFNVENVFDKSYWMSASLYRGAPRTFLFSATVSL
jgi:iron complex outermembrane receptor protein